MTRRTVVISLAVLVVVAVAVAIFSSGGERPAGPNPAPTTDLSSPVNAPKRSDAPRVVVAAKSSDGGATAAANAFLQTGWGSGPGQLGRERRKEGNPEAPMSFAVSRTGDVLFVDQTNNRIARFGPDGKWKDSVPSPVQAAQDVLATKDGKTLVLDRLADRHVSILDPDGKPLGELPLEGKSLAEGGAVTGMFVDGDNVYVEKEHGALVRIGNTKGERDELQPEIPGRPTRDGRSYLTAGLLDAAAGTVFVTAIDQKAMAQRFTRQYHLAPAVLMISLLDSDASGVIYLAANSNNGDSLTLLCIDPLDGHPLGSAELPPNRLPEETFKDLVVLDSGGVLYSYRTEGGEQLLRADCH